MRGSVRHVVCGGSLRSATPTSTTCDSAHGAGGGSSPVAGGDDPGDAAGDRRGGGGGGVMKIKEVMYKDDGKVETRLRFGDNLALVVSAPVRVAIEGDTSGLEEDEVNKLCRVLERGIARAL